MNYTLNVSSHSWNKDSNLLFDYESSDYYLHNQNLRTGGILKRNGKKFEFLQKSKKKQENYMGTISQKGDNYYLEYDEKLESEVNIPSIDEKMWIVIRNTQFKENEGYRLRDGDLMKLGKVIFKVKEIKVKSTNQKRIENKIPQNINNGPSNINKSVLVKERTIVDMKNQNVNQIDFEQVEKGKNINTVDIQEIPKENKKRYVLPQCRICLMDENESTNPLVNPCNCIGSVRFIHVDCIKKWLMSKITTKMFNFLIVHSFKNLECELCKKTLPEKIKFKNEIINIYEMQKPDNNYIMLESISREKRENRYLYIIHFKDKQSIKLGRANDSDVRMTDISVSRNHATLKLYNGYLYLQDNFSKFGTLIGLNSNVLVSPQKQLAIQCGRLYLLFNLKKSCLAAIRCYKNIYLSGLDYNDYLEDQYYKNKSDENVFEHLSCGTIISEYEFESCQSSVKLPRRSEEEIKEEDSQSKEFDEAAGIELAEINRENLLNSSGRNNQMELMKNQNQTDISLNRNNFNISDIPLKNLNEENKDKANSADDKNNNNILTTAFFNLNTSHANFKNPNGRISTENNLNIINEEPKKDQNFYLNSINDSENPNFLKEENLFKNLKKLNTVEGPKINKLIPLYSSHSKTEKHKSDINFDLNYEKIDIRTPNSNKNEKRSKSKVYSNLGTNEDISFIPISNSGKINYKLSSERNKKKEKSGKDKINQKKFRSEILLETDKSNVFQNISKLSRECLLNISNIKNENFSIEKLNINTDSNNNDMLEDLENKKEINRSNENNNTSKKKKDKDEKISCEITNENIKEKEAELFNSNFSLINNNLIQENSSNKNKETNNYPSLRESNKNKNEFKEETKFNSENLNGKKENNNEPSNSFFIFRINEDNNDSGKEKEKENIDKIDNLEKKTFAFDDKKKNCTNNIFNLDTNNNETNYLRTSNNDYSVNLETINKQTEERFNQRNFLSNNQIDELDLIISEESNFNSNEKMEKNDIIIITNLIEENKSQENIPSDQKYTLTEADNVIVTNIIDIENQKTEKETKNNLNDKDNEIVEYAQIIQGNASTSNKNIITVFNDNNSFPKLKKSATVEDIFEDLFTDDKDNQQFKPNTIIEKNNSFFFEKIKIDDDNANFESEKEEDIIDEKKSDKEKSFDFDSEKNQENLLKKNKEILNEEKVESISKTLLEEDLKKEINNEQSNHDVKNEINEEKNKQNLNADDFL